MLIDSIITIPLHSTLIDHLVCNKLLVLIMKTNQISIILLINSECHLTEFSLQFDNDDYADCYIRHMQKYNLPNFQNCLPGLWTQIKLTVVHVYIMVHSLSLCIRRLDGRWFVESVLLVVGNGVGGH